MWARGKTNPERTINFGRIQIILKMGSFLMVSISTVALGPSMVYSDEERAIIFLDYLHVSIIQGFLATVILYCFA